MKMQEAEQWLKQQAATVYDEQESSNIADWVMENITGLKRISRSTKSNDALLEKQEKMLTDIAQRLHQHEPVQYILGEAFFYGMRLFVDKHVLIPRPETEELVEWIVKDVKALGIDVFERRATEADETTKLKILDVGTGSGCIALALKKAMPKAEVWACDASDEALNVARRNGSDLDIRVDFVGLNFLSDAETRQLPTVDIIVSNPPYIPQKDKGTMRPNVLEHEPHMALFVPDNDALVFYEALAQFGKKRLHKNGCIYCEIHEDLGADVVKLFENNGYKKVVLKKDMQGKDRMVKCENHDF